MATYLDTWTLKKRLVPDEAAICVVFSPDASMIVSGGGSRRAILVWDSDSVKPRRLLEGKLKHRIWCAEFSDSGVWLACGEDDAGTGRSNSSIYLFQMPEFRLVHVFTGHRGKVSALSFVGDDFLLSAGRDGNVIGWNLESGEVDCGLSSGSFISSMAISKDLEHIVTGHAMSGKINLWGTQSMELEHTWTVKGGLLDAQGASWTRKLLFLNSEVVVVGHDQQHFTLWNVQTKERVGTVKHTGGTFDLALSPNGQLLAQIGSKGMVTLWDTASWQKRVLTDKHGVPFASNGRTAINFSSDGVQMVSAALKNEIFVWAST